MIEMFVLLLSSLSHIGLLDSREGVKVPDRRTGGCESDFHNG